MAVVCKKKENIFPVFNFEFGEKIYFCRTILLNEDNELLKIWSMLLTKRSIKVTNNNNKKAESEKPEQSRKQLNFLVSWQKLIL
jgi:hypothetical protein